jgi:putative redox protein
MKARVNRAGALRYIGGSGTSLGVMMDVSATPESVTPLSILSMEMQQSVEAIVVELAAVRADQPPKVFTKTLASFTVIGDGPLKKAGKAVSLSAEKCCSANRMLAETAEITHEIKVVAENAKPCLPTSPSA